MTKRTLNATAGALLGFLHAGPMSGWDLVSTARTVVGDFWTVTQSQVYRELTAMSRDGLVSAGRAGVRERRPYKITTAGRAAFARWLRQPPGSEQIRYPLLLTMSFGAHLSPALLGEFVAEHRAEHAARLAAYRQKLATMGDDADVYAVATLDFGIRYETAVLQWCDHLPPQIKE